MRATRNVMLSKPGEDRVVPCRSSRIMKTILVAFANVTLVCGALAQDGKEHPKQEIQQLIERARDAKTAGRFDEANELAAQAARLQAELHAREGTKPPMNHPDKAPHPFGKGPEAERLWHIVQAVEHLHSAGLREQARGIEQIAQQVRAEIEERMKREHAEASDKGKSQGRDVRAGAELEEMRQQMRRMAEQIEQLQAALKQQGKE